MNQSSRNSVYEAGYEFSWQHAADRIKRKDVKLKTWIKAERSELHKKITVRRLLRVFISSVVIHSSLCKQPVKPMPNNSGKIRSDSDLYSQDGQNDKSKKQTIIR